MKGKRDMSRAIKYITEGEKMEALKLRQKRYYEKNKRTIIERNLRSYYKKKGDEIKSNNNNIGSDVVGIV